MQQIPVVQTSGPGGPGMGVPVAAGQPAASYPAAAMAGGGRLRARATFPQLRPCGLADAESKLARKSAVVEALHKIHSDRAVQTYNELVQKVESDLQHLWNNHKGSVDDLARAVQKLCAVNHVSWTKVHHARTRGKDHVEAKAAPRAASPTPQDALPSTPTTGRLR